MFISSTLFHNATSKLCRNQENFKTSENQTVLLLCAWCLSHSLEAESKSRSAALQNSSTELDIKADVVSYEHTNDKSDNTDNDNTLNSRLSSSNKQSFILRCSMDSNYGTLLMVASQLTHRIVASTLTIHSHDQVRCVYYTLTA